MLLLLFISFYNALWEDARTAQADGEIIVLVSSVFGGVESADEWKRVFLFPTGRWVRCVWVSLMVTTIHVNPDHTAGSLCLNARWRRRVRHTLCALCVQCSEWCMSGGGCDPMTSATEAMPAWSRGLCTLLDPCTKALNVFFFFPFFFACVYLWLHVVINRWVFITLPWKGSTSCGMRLLLPAAGGSWPPVSSQTATSEGGGVVDAHRVVLFCLFLKCNSQPHFIIPWCYRALNWLYYQRLMNWFIHAAGFLLFCNVCGQ